MLICQKALEEDVTAYDGRGSELNGIQEQYVYITKE